MRRWFGSESPKKKIIWNPSNWKSGSPLLRAGWCIPPCPSSICYSWSWYPFGHMQGLCIIDTILHWFCSFQQLLSVLLGEERLNPRIFQSGLPQSLTYFPELFYINKTCSERSFLSLELVSIGMLMRSKFISVPQAKQRVAVEVFTQFLVAVYIERNPDRISMKQSSYWY